MSEESIINEKNEAMNEAMKEFLKKIVHEEFENNYSKNIDCSRIFAYVQSLEQKIENAKKLFDMDACIEDIYNELYCLFCLEEDEYKLPFDEEVQIGLDSLNIRKDNND